MADGVFYPGYTEDLVYKELVAMAENAGIEVVYSEKKDDNVIGAASTAEDMPKIIHMMTNHDYGTQEYVDFVFAHELAHVCVYGFYSEAVDHFYSDLEYIHRFQEADADKIGAALYRLAEMTATYKAEAWQKG